MTASVVDFSFRSAAEEPASLARRQTTPRLFIVKSHLLLLFAALLLCPAARAETACPWLTEGTAAAFLSSPVTASTNVSRSGEGTCTFTGKQSDSTSLLEISVASADHPGCPSDSKPLAGIGNEAVLCAPNETTEIVSSRVRNLYFTVRLTLSGKPAITLTQQQSAAEQIAEQIAGSLF